jgi:ABC-2 type transport system ATP-binding protein
MARTDVGRLLPALLPLLLLILALVIYCLVDLVRTPHAPYLPKWAWVPVILLVTPWGAVLYLVLARTQRAATGAPAPAAASPRPTAILVPGPVPAGAVGAVVSTDGLTRDYGGGAGLFDVDLRVPHGCVYGLVGPNGAGKTTLLSILTGLRRADRGTVHIGAPRNRIAVCPDVPEFEPWLTAFEVVDLSRHYVAAELGADAVLDTLRTVGLDADADRRVGGFSRGMTQRLGLAAALIGDPRVLLLDEPTSALDPAGRAEILDLVAAMRGHRTVVFSSHILADVQRVADQVGVLRAGRLIYQGATSDLVDRYLDPRWVLRLSNPVEQVVRALADQPWTRRVETLGGQRIRVDADTVAHGEQGIPQVLAACHARLISCEPLAADLEAAFLALTAKEEVVGGAGRGGAWTDERSEEGKGRTKASRGASQGDQRA